MTLKNGWKKPCSNLIIIRIITTIPYDTQFLSPPTGEVAVSRPPTKKLLETSVARRFPCIHPSAWTHFRWQLWCSRGGSSRWRPTQLKKKGSVSAVARPCWFHHRQRSNKPRIHQKHALCATETPKLDSIHRQPRKSTNPIGCWTKFLAAHKICTSTAKSEGQVIRRESMSLDRDFLIVSRIFNCPPRDTSSSLAVFQPQLGVYIWSCQKDVISNHHCISLCPLICWWAGDIVDRTDMDRSFSKKSGPTVPPWPSQFSVPRMQKTGEDQMDEASRKHATCPRRHISTQLSPSGNTTKPRWIKFWTFQNVTKMCAEVLSIHQRFSISR